MVELAEGSVLRNVLVVLALPLSGLHPTYPAFKPSYHSVLKLQPIVDCTGILQGPSVVRPWMVQQG
jgi:hypothetical protein